MDKKLPLSVAIISFNEEDNISRTLESVAPIASEIIVVDSHSGDGTVNIAESFGAKVFTEDWKGHVAQKNSALEKCTCEWILSLDCDEVPDAHLIESIKNAVNNPSADGYCVNRRTFYMGKFLKYSWQPDWKLRLVKRAAGAKWGGYDPHDRLILSGRTAKITGDLLHYSYRDIYDHYQRLVKYAKVAAQSYDRDGKKFSYGALLTKPLFAFVKKYFLKLGILDGFAGFAVAVSTLIYVYLKYLFLREIQNGRKNG